MRSSGRLSPAAGGANTEPISNSDTSGVPWAALNAAARNSPGSRSRPQQRLLGPQRVLDLDHRVGGEPGACQIGRREQRQRVRLVVAGADEHVRDHAPLALERA